MTSSVNPKDKRKAKLIAAFFIIYKFKKKLRLNILLGIHFLISSSEGKKLWMQSFNVL